MAATDRVDDPYPEQYHAERIAGLLIERNYSHDTLVEIVRSLLDDLEIAP